MSIGFIVGFDAFNWSRICNRVSWGCGVAVEIPWVPQSRVDDVGIVADFTFSHFVHVGDEPIGVLPDVLFWLFMTVGLVDVGDDGATVLWADTVGFGCDGVDNDAGDRAWEPILPWEPGAVPHSIWTLPGSDAFARLYAAASILAVCAWANHSQSFDWRFVAINLVN